MNLLVTYFKNIILAFIFFASLTFAGGQAMNNNQLTLEVDGLQVYLVNQGDELVIAMPNGRSLPLLTVELLDGDGKKVTINNRGDLMKFDNTIYARDFVELAAGDRLKIGEAKLTDNRLDLDLFFANLMPGTYQLTFIYTNNTHQYFDQETQRLVDLDNVWCGKIENRIQSLIIK